MVPDGEWLRQGAFKYPESTERLRWSRTREILERIKPGPHEDADYIAMLAHQAAAIELCIAQWPRFTEHNSDLLTRIIIGTTVAPRSQGSTSLVAGCSVIEMSAGMIDLLYQSAKAIVLSWKRTDPKGKAAVGFSDRREDTEEVLDGNPYSTDLLCDTLATWLYEGRSRASYSEAPPDEYHPPLKLILSGAERFVLAHEYGHAVMDLLAPQDVPATNWERELRADDFATMVVAQSSDQLDLLPPAIALRGAVVAMRAHDVLDAALQIACHGHETGSTSSSTHPSFETRLAALERFFVEASDDAKMAREQLPDLRVPAVTLGQLWDRIAPLLRAQHRAGRRLHAIWKAA